MSPWALIDWAERTALPALLGVRISKSGKDRLYQVGDVLFAHHKAIEEGLRKGEAGLFGLASSIVLYDITNTHFEGLCHKNPKARHGKNKQKRNDCRQVAVGIDLDCRGLALAHEVVEGDIAETKAWNRCLIDWPCQAQSQSSPWLFSMLGLYPNRTLLCSKRAV